MTLAPPQPAGPSPNPNAYPYPLTLKEEEFILVHGEKYVHINHVHKHGRHASAV